MTNNQPETTLQQVDIDPSKVGDFAGICKGFLTEKSANADDRTVRGVASTINVDRDGDVILPSAFRKDLKRFLATNAPFLAAHRHRSEDGQPTQIGWVIDGKVTAAALECTFKYALTEMGEQWWKLASDEGGKGHAFSVGFIPRRYVTGTVTDLVGSYPELADVFRQAGRKGEDRALVYTEVELLEISACPVPSNRESIQLMQKLAIREAMEGFDWTKMEPVRLLEGPDMTKVVSEAFESAIRNPQSAIRTYFDITTQELFNDLAVEIDRQLSEIRCLFPDVVNPGEAVHGKTCACDPDGDGEGDAEAEAQEKSQAMKAAGRAFGGQ